MMHSSSTGANAAVLFGDVEIHQPHLPRLFEDFPRPLSADIMLGGLRAELLSGQSRVPESRSILRSSLSSYIRLSFSLGRRFARQEVDTTIVADRIPGVVVALLNTTCPDAQFAAKG